MKKEIRQFPFEIRAMDDDTGIIEGYASVFDNLIETWQGSEVVRKGAFAKTLKENRGKVAIFRSHDTDRQIGIGVKAHEDDFGLFVQGEIAIHDGKGRFAIDDARDEWTLARMHAEQNRPRGISIGFSTLKEGVVKKFKGIQNVRELLELKLWEWSPTPFPANNKAGIIQLRHADLEEINEQIADERFDMRTLEKTIDRLTAFNQAVHESTEPDLLHSIDSTIAKLRRLN